MCVCPVCGMLSVVAVVAPQRPRPRTRASALVEYIAYDFAGQFTQLSFESFLSKPECHVALLGVQAACLRLNDMKFLSPTRVCAYLHPDICISCSSDLTGSNFVSLLVVAVVNIVESPCKHTYKQ